MGNISNHSVFEVQNLRIGYVHKRSNTVVADNLNFSLKEGELTAIIGVNGAGKSTLLRTMARVQPKLSGAINVGSLALEELKSEQLATRMSIVLTEPMATKNLTVKELISLGRQPYTNWLGVLTQTDLLKIQEAIKMVELTAYQDRKCYELSDGQLQKVLIARALAQDTSIIFLDEPTTHLDLYHKAQILKMLKRIAHTLQKTIVYTTHEIDIAIQLCDKMLILDQPISHFGSPCELIENEHFQSLFPSDTIGFDATTGSFKIKK
ncbi:MAG: ABC transporter ATP-binding protein [Eudoraea sp.]|nr:ABC transporter ATP-binding protein [Eudoraea sp.]